LLEQRTYPLLDLPKRPSPLCKRRFNRYALLRILSEPRLGAESPFR
jgi:hypothetical protein